MAQIDLAEVAEAGGPEELPATGSLAFFLGSTDTARGRVMHVPAIADRAMTLPPVDMPPFQNVGGEQYYRADGLGRPLFPFWPVDMTRIDLPAVDDRVQRRQSQADNVARLFGKRRYNLGVAQVFEGPPIPRWWHTAFHFAGFLAEKLAAVPQVIVGEARMVEFARGKLAEARSKGPAAIAEAGKLLAMYETRLADCRKLEPAFMAYVGGVADWVLEHEDDQWQLMSDADWEQLEVFWTRRLEFPDFSGYWGEPGFQVLPEQMFKALPAEGSVDFAEMPLEVQALVRARRVPRPQWWLSAIELVRLLGEAEAKRVPEQLATLEARLAEQRRQLARLRPGGALGSLWRRATGEPKDVSAIEAQIAKAEEKLAALRRLAAEFSGFVAEAIRWTEGWDPLAVMTPDDASRLAAIYAEARGKERFEPFTRYGLPFALQDMEVMTLRRLAAGPDRAFASIPEAARRRINDAYRTPIDFCHQLFGEPADIQGNHFLEEPAQRMLLQLAFDDMMFWSFGDNGVYQFWIKEDDLARQNWDAVEVSFECH